uniref:Uncharacterized protein n=1 Tax=Panagrolaimus davidi TaxID=227884 RepID=A0A914QZY0_9BILA
MNILNEPYNISTFHYNEIQPVLVRLEGNMLKIRRPEKNMLKHALYDDPTFLNEDPVVISESIYDLTNAMVKLRPQDLARNRWFSRRYPICIKLSSPDSEVHSRNEERFLKLQQEVFEGEHKKHHNPINKVKKMIKKRKNRRASITTASSIDSEDYAPPRAKRFTRQASDIETGYNSDGFYDDDMDNVSIASNGTKN